MSIAAFKIKSTSKTGAQPFCIGHAFTDDDVFGVPTTQPYVTLDIVNYSVVPLAYWNSGRLKHAMIMGYAPLQAINTDLQINLDHSNVSPTATSAAVAASILQSQINAAAAGSTIDVTGNSYTGSITINKALTLIGAKITSSAGQVAVTVTASDVTLSGCIIQGPQATTYDAGAIGISAYGTSGAHIARLNINGCAISTFGNSGITTNYVDNCSIRNNFISDTVYSGIMVLSATGGLVEYNAVSRIGVFGAAANSNNAYGIAISSQNPAVDIQSSSVIVNRNFVQDVPTWHGLDTHAGLSIQFTNNYVLRCRDSIYITGDSSSRRNQNCVTTGNRIEAPSGADQYGITSVYSTGGTITGNNIIGYPSGHEVLTTSSGIPEATSTGLTISGNINAIGTATASPTGVQVAPPLKTSMTFDQITALNPTASVTLSGIGTASLSSVIGAATQRTYVATKNMVEAHYLVNNVGGNADVYVWFHVRLFSGGECRIRVIVGNGSLDNGSGAVNTRTDRTYTASVTIGSTVTNVNSGSSYLHYANTRWDVEGWLASNPDIVVRHDTGYLMQTKLVPNYWKTNPSTSAINAYARTYTPGSLGHWSNVMGGTGYQPQIGILPDWEAMYCTSSANATLYNTVQEDTRSANSFPIVMCDKSTRNPINLTTFGTWTNDGPGQGGNTTVSAASSTLVWDIAHHPSMGYLAYLLRADYYFLETMRYNVNTCFLLNTSANGTGTARDISGQIRGRGWIIRTLAQFCALVPTTGVTTGLDGLAKTWLTTVVTNRYNKYVVPTYAAKFMGYENAYLNRLTSNNTSENSLAPNGFYGSGQGPWEYHFVSQSAGHAGAIEPLGSSAMTTLRAYRDWALQAPCWITGGTGVDEYNFGYASQYTLIVPVNTADTGGVYDTNSSVASPGQIWQYSNQNAFVVTSNLSLPSTSYGCTVTIDRTLYGPSTLTTPVTITYASGTNSFSLSPAQACSVNIGSTNTAYASGATIPYSDTSNVPNGMVIKLASGAVLVHIYGSLSNGDHFTLTRDSTYPQTNPTTTTLLGYSGGTPGDPQGYYANLLPALAYAVDNGISGAQAGWDRLRQGATNSATFMATPFDDNPVFGIVPRNYSQMPIQITPSAAPVTTRNLTAANSAMAPTSSAATLNAVGNGGDSMRVWDMSAGVNSLIPNAVVVGDFGLGVLGSAVPSTGRDGPSAIYNDLTFPTDANHEVMMVVTSQPAAGTLTTYEDGSFSFTGAPNGSYFFDYTLYYDGFAQGSARVTMNVGNTLTCDTAHFTVGSHGATFPYGRVVNLAKGAFVMSTRAATFPYSHVLNCAKTSYAITFHALTSVGGAAIVADPGHVVVTPYTATLGYFKGIPCDTGHFFVRPKIVPGTVSPSGHSGKSRLDMMKQLQFDSERDLNHRLIQSMTFDAPQPEAVQRAPKYSRPLSRKTIRVGASAPRSTQPAPSGRRMIKPASSKPKGK